MIKHSDPAVLSEVKAAAIDDVLGRCPHCNGLIRIIRDGRAAPESFKCLETNVTHYKCPHCAKPFCIEGI